MYRLGSRRTSGLIALVIANESYVLPLSNPGGPLRRRYLELHYAHFTSLVCNESSPGDAAAAVLPAVVSPAGAVVSNATWLALGGASGGAGAAAAAALRAGEFEARRCRFVLSWALYDIKWDLQASAPIGIVISSTYAGDRPFRKPSAASLDSCLCR